MTRRCCRCRSTRQERPCGGRGVQAESSGLAAGTTGRQARAMISSVETGRHSALPGRHGPGAPATGRRTRWSGRGTPDPAPPHRAGPARGPSATGRQGTAAARPPGRRRGHGTAVAHGKAWEDHAPVPARDAKRHNLGAKNLSPLLSAFPRARSVAILDSVTAQNYALGMRYTLRCWPPLSPSVTLIQRPGSMGYYRKGGRLG
jgi:hypothetical protein